MPLRSNRMKNMAFCSSKSKEDIFRGLRIPKRKRGKLLEGQSASSSSSLYVTEDVWLQIFLRLPVDSVHRMKCVSKRWLALISDTYFIRSYIKYRESLPPPMVQHFMLYWLWVKGDIIGDGSHLELCKMDHPPLSSSKLLDSSFNFCPGLRRCPRDSLKPGLNCGNEFRVMSVSHGLTLCKVEYNWSSRTYNPRDYYVCNPLTKQCLELPRLPDDCFRSGRPGSSALVCHPLDNDLPYKVKFTVLELDGRDSYTRVFSSETGCWNEYRVTCPNRDLYWVIEPHVVFYNSMFYWEAHSCVVVYDPIDSPNQCNAIDLPQKVVNKDEHHLHCSQGKVRLSSCIPDTGHSCFVWELVGEDCVKGEGEGGRWNLVYKFSCRPCTSDDFNDIEFFSQTNEEIVCFRLIAAGVVFLYNMKERSTEHVLRFPNKNLSQMFVLPFSLTSWPTLIPQLPPKG